MKSTPLGTDTLMQIGLVVHNIKDTVQAWSLLLGVPCPGIIVIDPVDLAHTEYRNQPTPARAKLAFSQLGQVALSLIEPVGEPSTWNDQLVTYGQSLHHIAFKVRGMADRLKVLAELGLPLLQRGGYEGGRYAYLDGRQRYGTVLEDD